jgi:D-alanyl-D-alanine carboxypeptidase/D-alanyl-D-alanine-endopeptidase (penicillin-binding protein 4)
MRAWLVVVLAGLASAQGGSGAGARSKDLGSILAEARAQGLDVGFVAVDLDTGRRLGAQDPDLPRTPASTMKLLTAAAVLLALGPDHAILTDLVSHGGVQDGGLHGVLRLRGEGDPTLRSEIVIPRMVESVRAAGIYRVHGRIVVDDRLFDREVRGASWPKGGPETAYLAEVGALSLDHGTAEVLVRAGPAPGTRAEVFVRPATASLRILPEVATVGVRDEHVIAISRAPGTNELRVTGKARAGTAEQSFAVAVEDPGLLFGRLLQEALAKAGVEVTGGVERARAEDVFDAGQVLFRCSTPVRDVLPVLLARSQNHRAEMLFKHLGAAVDAGGTFGAGSAAVRSVLARAGVDLRGANILDGSGLSRDNALSPAQLVQVLAAMWASPHRDVFRESLAAGGGEGGTLASRLGDLGDRLRAKTGTLRGVSTLAGYVKADSGSTVAFAILVQLRQPSRLAMREVQDRLVRALARSQS